MSLKENMTLKAMREVNIRADSKSFRDSAASLGAQATRLFADKSQLKKLENTGNSALKITDIYNYIKRQTGKDGKAQNWNKEQFGTSLLQKLQGVERDEGENICTLLAINVPEDRMEVNLMLAREFIRQMVIHYEYEMRDR